MASEIILKEGRFWRRDTVEYDLGTQEAVLSRCASGSTTWVRNAFMHDGKLGHISVGPKAVVYVIPIDSLPFNTWFEASPRNADQLQPCFFERRGSIKMGEPYPAKLLDGQFYFALTYTVNDGLPLASSAYLFLYRENELKHFGYPNHFGDGRVCMGLTWDRQRNEAPTTFEKFVHAYTSFHETETNNHLTDGLTIAVFRKNLKGEWLKPLPATFDNFRTVSLACMAGWKP